MSDKTEYIFSRRAGKATAVKVEKISQALINSSNDYNISDQNYICRLCRGTSPYGTGPDKISHEAYCAVLDARKYLKE